MVKGRCLCGEISYVLNGEILYLYNCQECRAFSGSSYAKNALIMTEDLQVSDPGITTVLEKEPEINLWVSEKCTWVEVDESLRNYTRAFE